MELQKDRAGWQRVLIVSCVLELFLGHWGATEDSRQGKGSDCRPGERKPAGGASCEAAGTCQAEEEARVRGGFWKGSRAVLGAPCLFMPDGKWRLWGQLLWPQRGKPQWRMAEPPTSHSAPVTIVSSSRTTDGHLGPFLQKTQSL